MGQSKPVTCGSRMRSTGRKSSGFLFRLDVGGFDHRRVT